MRWFFKIILNLLKRKKMILDEFREENGELDPEVISEAYVLFDYENNPICICVCVKGTWFTFTPFDEKLDSDLKKTLGNKYTNRYLSELIKIQDEFGADLLARSDLLNKSKKIR